MNRPTVLPSSEILPTPHGSGTVEHALQNPQMAGNVANTLVDTRTGLGNLRNQVSPGIGPNFANTALPAIGLLGVVAITYNAMRMVIGGKQRGILTGREGKLV